MRLTPLLLRPACSAPRGERPPSGPGLCDVAGGAGRVGQHGSSTSTLSANDITSYPWAFSELRTGRETSSHSRLPAALHDARATVCQTLDAP